MKKGTTMPRKTPPAAPADHHHHDDELVDKHEAARLFCVHVSTWARYWKSGRAPEPVALGPQKRLWWRSELLAARARLPRASEIRPREDS